VKGSGRIWVGRKVLSCDASKAAIRAFSRRRLRRRDQLDACEGDGSWSFEVSMLAGLTSTVSV
jgi:hypothetical protein